jgi:hypothetical protein
MGGWHTLTHNLSSVPTHATVFLSREDTADNSYVITTHGSGAVVYVEIDAYY